MAKSTNASTGPRSAEGKARSSLNALKSGIYSKSLVIPGEDRAALDTLKDEYYQRFQPALPEQRDLVDVLVRATWTLRRLAVAEAQVWGYVTDLAAHLDEPTPLGHAFYKSDRTLERLQRIVNSTQRNYRQALHELERLQPRGPAPAPPPPPPVGLENHGPVLVPGAPPPSEPTQVNPSREFVSSTPDPLPFHKPGAECYFDPLDRRPYSRCPLCFPDRSHPE